MNNPSPYRSFENYKPVLGLVAILGAITYVSWEVDPAERTRTWLLTLLLMALFAIVVGRAITGYWRGILIDSRNRMSLSRLQFLAWTMLILSAILVAVVSNVSDAVTLPKEMQSPLAITIPSELWTLMGISAASAVGAPAILNNKSKKRVDTGQLQRTAALLRQDSMVSVDEQNDSILIRNQSPSDARWGDLLKGDEAADATSVDLGKLQMFFFSFILIVGYAAAIASIFDQGGAVLGLPVVEQGMNVLLGISQTGYLANKSVVTSRTGANP